MRCIDPAFRSAKLANGREDLPSAGFSDACGRKVSARDGLPFCPVVAHKQRENRLSEGPFVSCNQPGRKRCPREEYSNGT
jgi:hypothetical protein